MGARHQRPRDIIILAIDLSEQNSTPKLSLSVYHLSQGFEIKAWCVKSANQLVSCLWFYTIQFLNLQTTSLLIALSVCFSYFQDSTEGHFRVRYDVTEVPITLPFQKPLADKPNPKQGIGKPSVPSKRKYMLLHLLLFQILSSFCYNVFLGCMRLCAICTRVKPHVLLCVFVVYLVHEVYGKT